MPDIFFGIYSHPLKCRCGIFDVKVVKRGLLEEVEGCVAINVSKGIALSEGRNPVYTNDECTDLKRQWIDSVELRCKHGIVFEDDVQSHLDQNFYHHQFQEEFKNLKIG